jgi:hypothetical protein
VLRRIGYRTAALIRKWDTPSPSYRSFRRVLLKVGDRIVSVVPGTQIVITETGLRPGGLSLNMECWDFATGKKIGTVAAGRPSEITHIQPKSPSSPYTGIPGLFFQALVVSSFRRDAADSVEEYVTRI